MNTKQLVYFLKTAELSSIAAAARALDIAQPSISLQLGNLEHELDCPLFERDHRGVRLTEHGTRFRAHAESILRQIEQAKLELRQVDNEPAGCVAIGMTQPIGNVISVPLLTKVKALFPRVELDLYAGLSCNLSQQLQSGELDLAISSPDGSDTRHLRQEPLFRERLYLAMGPEPKLPAQRQLLTRTSIRFAELAEHELIVTGRQDSLGYLLDDYERKTGIRLNHQPAFGQLMTTLRYVADGHGLLLCPSSAFYHLEQSGQIHALEIIEPQLWREVHINTAVERPHTRLLRTLSRLIREVTREEHAQGHWRGELEPSPTEGRSL